MKRIQPSLLFVALLVGACGGDDADSGPALVAFAPASTDICPNGGQLVLTGYDADGDGLLTGDEIVQSTPVCSGDPGTMGTTGLPGNSGLLKVSDEAAGASCTSGGLRLDVGLDDDGDGTLGDAEIDQTTYVCDGEAGVDGLQTLVDTATVASEACGGRGVQLSVGLDADRDGVLDAAEVDSTELVCLGNEGLSSLVSTSTLAAGPECAVGGRRVSSGVDTNGNGVLDATEVDGSQVLCDPVTSRVRVSAVLPGDTNCPFGGSRIESGLDLDDDGELDDAEVDDTTYACSGADGRRSLVVSVAEPAGANCPEGGRRLDVGTDANANGVLEAAEIDGTSYVCSGSRGADGTGNLLRVGVEAPGANCAAGGTRLQTGPDSNGNGALDDAEVSGTSYVCDGAATTTLVRVEAEPAGANCANGGRRVLVGTDTNLDEILQSGEVTTTRYVCDRSTSGTVPFAITTSALSGPVEGVAYTADITAVGGAGGDYRWSVISGALPPGLSLTPSGTPSATLAGTSTVTGSYSFTVRVEDYFGGSVEASYTVSVTPVPCAPGRDGAVGQTLTTLTVPSSFSASVRAMAADASATGWVYFVEPGIGFNRFRKDGSGKEDDIHTGFSLAAGDIGYEMDIDGNDIYLTNDSTSCTSMCVYRVSSDGGATFSIQDMATFTSAPNDDLRGIAVRGNTMYVITHDSVETELYSIDISGTLPATATRLGVFSGLEYCSGLDVDANYLYTVCNDIDGTNRVGIARIALGTWAASPYLATPSFFTVGTDIISGVYGQDLDADGGFDILYVTGDSGDDLYSCTGATGSRFEAEWLTAFSGDDEGMAFDLTSGRLYKVDESSTTAGAFR